MPQRTTQRPTIPPGLAEFDHLPDAAFARIKVVAALLGCSVNTVWRRCKSGDLPPAISISPGVTGINVGALRRRLAVQA
jgi:helix-turn-helix protein